MKHEKKAKDLIAGGHLLEAIRIIRNANNLGLKESKDTCVKWRDEMGLTPPDAPSSLRPPQALLRVWWIPQVPMEPFRVAVANLREAKLLLDTLAKYDIFQLEHRVKPDYSNAGGLEVFVDGEWSEWEDEDGYDIDHTALA